MALSWVLSDHLTGSYKAVCTAPASETFGAGALDGVSLVNARGLSLYVEADAGWTVTGVGKLLAWKQNHLTGVWSRCSGLDVASTEFATGARGAGNPVIISAGSGLPVIDMADRIAFVTDSGWTVGGGNLNIFHNVCLAKHATG